MLHLLFKPQSDQFELATREYQDIWGKEREAIIDTFEKVTGLEFKQKLIEIVIYEGPSFSGNLNCPMKLRASLPYKEKQGTLVHELGHRLINPLQNRIEGIDEHHTLNLFLYDVWNNLYGKEFADQMVTIENKKNIRDYESAWRWFFRLSKEEKSSIWNRFIDLNRG